MRIVNAGYEIMDNLDGAAILEKIERGGRVCYKSEDKITSDSAEKFVRSIIKRGHESVLEHVSFTVRFIVDRGVSHELVRHRIASFSQESTRYCNYSKDKFGNELTFIKPCFWEKGSLEYQKWEQAMQMIEDTYNEMIAMGAKPQEARSILPNSLKTELIVTMDLREWRHFFRLRTAERAHPQMREVASMLLEEMKGKIDVLFDDL